MKRNGSQLELIIIIIISDAGQTTFCLAFFFFFYLNRVDYTIIMIIISLSPPRQSTFITYYNMRVGECTRYFCCRYIVYIGHRYILYSINDTPFFFSINPPSSAYYIPDCFYPVILVNNEHDIITLFRFHTNIFKLHIIYLRGNTHTILL